MKPNLKAVFTAFIVFAFQRSVFAQVNNAEEGTISIPTTIARETDIYFENNGDKQMASITVSPIETIISKTGEVLVRHKARSGAGSYRLTGQIGYLYAITLPTSLTVNTGEQYITIEQFTSYPSANGILDAHGTQQIKIGATYNVNAQQPDNLTSSGTAQVTINYN